MKTYSNRISLELEFPSKACPYFHFDLIKKRLKKLTNCNQTIRDRTKSYIDIRDIENNNVPSKWRVHEYFQILGLGLRF
jgi:hypothetical protein